MKVRELMTSNPAVCDLNASVSEAARKMWDSDCGVLPVLKDGREVVGLLTDRDICMALVINDCKASDVSAEKIISGQVYSVTPEDEIQTALALMQENKVRRLPVITDEGDLKGMVSMNDVVLRAEEVAGKKPPAITYADVVNTFKSICLHPVPLQQKASAG